MATIQWQDEYSIGVKELDDQHRRLLGIINVLIEEQKNPPGSRGFKDDISSLIHYAYTHFATEECYLLQAQFPGLQAHIVEHIDFIMKTLELASKIGEADKQSRQELLQFLENWYSSHVLGIDRQYIPFLASQSIK